MRSRFARTSLHCDPLDSRINPATTASFVNGTLTILGDGANDTVVLGQSGGTLTLNGGQTFATGGVTRVVIDGGAGNDTINCAGVQLPCFLYGSSGNDVITGGAKNDQLFGGHGADVLDGSGGDDLLVGGTGADTFTDLAGTNTTTQASAFRAGTQSDLENQIVALVNQQRAANGLSPLAVSTQLTSAAQMQSQNMADLSAVVGTSQAMSHTLLGTTAPNLTNRADQVGYDYSYIGENIAFGYSTAQAVMDAWMNSAGHRANILEPNYTQVGVSVRANATGLMYFTQTFASVYPGSTAPTAGSGTTTGGSATVTTTPTTTTTLPVTTPNGPTAAKSLVAVSLAGGSGQVAVYDAATGSLLRTLAPYGAGYAGGVRVATGDVDGDGYEDVVTAAGPGGGPHVMAYNGRTGAVLKSFFAYDMGYRGGVNLAVGDIDGDGKAEIVTGTGSGGGPHVKAFSGADNHEVRSFLAYNAGFLGGVNVAVGDVNGDGRADIVVGAGAGGGPHVQVFSGTNNAVLKSFFAYDVAFTGGVNVAVGDTDGDGKADIVTGTGTGGGPHVQVFSGATNAVLKSFFAFTTSFTGGVRVATADLDGDGKADIIVGGGYGQSSKATSFKGTTLASLKTFDGFDLGYLGGVYVG